MAQKSKDMKLVSKWLRRYGANYYFAKPNFHTFTILNKDIIHIRMISTQMTLNKPIYVRISYISFIKEILCDFRYDYILNKLPNFVKLLNSDTEQWVYQFFYNDEM